MALGYEVKNPFSFLALVISVVLFFLISQARYYQVI